MARNRFLARLIFLVFFVISLLTNILGPIVPDIISTFSVTLEQQASSSSRSSSPMASCPSPPDFSSSATPKSLS